MMPASRAFRLAALALFAAAPAIAQTARPTDPLSGYYANTLHISVQDYEADRFFEPDHTYRDRVDGEREAGVWTVEGNRICTQASGAAKYCNLGLGRSAGDSWVDRDPYTGNEVKFTLEAGRKADR